MKKTQNEREDGDGDVADELLYGHAKSPYCQWDYYVKWAHGALNRQERYEMKQVYIREKLIRKIYTEYRPIGETDLSKVK